MKTKYLFLYSFLTFFLLTGCAAQVQQNNHVSDALHTLEAHVCNKVQALDDKVLLRSVNDFIDKLWEVKASGEEITIIAYKKNSFPDFLENILSNHPRLNTLPRDPKTLIILESTRTPGVKNVFIRVPAEYVNTTECAKDWMPENWAIDLKRNNLLENDVQKAYLTLFWMGNIKTNPELITSIKESGWEWEKMIHPKDTASKCMFIPLATLNSVTEKLL